MVLLGDSTINALKDFRNSLTSGVYKRMNKGIGVYQY